MNEPGAPMTSGEVLARIVELLRARAYYTSQGLPVAAIENAQEANKLAQQHGMLAQQANIHVHLAEDQAFLLGSYEAAAENAQRCLELSEQLIGNNKTKIATAYSVIGFCAAQQHHYVDSVWALREALDTLADLRQQKPTDLSIHEQRTLLRAFINLANSFALVGEYLRARDLYLKGLELARAVSNQVALITLLENLGHYEILLGNYAQAEAYLVEGEALARTATHADWLERLSYFHQMRAEVYFRRGELRDAWRYASQALDMHVRQLFHFDRSVVADVNALMGNIYLASGAYQTGLDCLQRAERIYHHRAMVAEADRVHLQLALGRILLESGSLLPIERPNLLSAEEERSFVLLSQIMDLLFDMYTAEEEVADHSDRVVRYALLLARHLNLPAADIEALAYIGPLHDLGKMRVPPEILNKPGALTEEEFSLMKRHPEEGVEILLQAALGLSDEALALLRHHHERWDGKGYPAGLQGEAIPAIARALSVADSYDAMTMDRPYRKGMSHGEAMRRLAAAAGSQFDPAVVAAWEALHQVPADFKHVASW